MCRNQVSCALLALVVLLALPLVALAQPVEPIALGETITGQLSGDSLWRQYRLDGAAGQMVTINLVSDAFDSYLKLDGPDGITLATDDDGGGSLNARIVDFALPADGAYLVSAGSFNQYSIGEFTLSVSEGSTAGPAVSVTFTPQPSLTASSTPLPTLTPSPAVALALSGAEISYNQPVTGTLTVDMPAAIYTFQGSVGENVTISLTSSDFDAYLELLGPDGASLATDDDSLGNLNARIEGFVLPESGMYTIRVGSFGGGVSGTFELSIVNAQIEPLVTEEPAILPPITPTPDVLTTIAGQTFSEVLTWDMDTRHYTFSGQAGDTVTFRMESSDFDSYLELYGPDGTLLASDDDSGPKYGAVIENFHLPVNGEYRLLASSFNRLSTGLYELSVSGTLLMQVDAPIVTLVIAEPGTPLALGMTTRGQLSDGQERATYTFNVEVAQPVTITVESTDFDSLLTLLGANGTVLAVDDDSGGDLNARIENFMLPGPGAYTIVVESFSPPAGGQFSLSLQSGAAISIEPTPEPVDNTIRFGELISGALTSGQEQTTYLFQGEAGQMVTILAVSEDFDAFLRLLDPNGAEIASDDDGGGGLNAQISLYVLPVNGAYSIVLQDYNGTSGAFTLSLSAASRLTIEYGQTRDGQVGGAEPAVAYAFRGASGDVITISARSSSFDTFLSLREAGSSVPLVEDDDNGISGSDSLIGPYTLPTTGEYLIVVRGYDVSAVGPYSLQLSRVELTPIAYGDVVVARFSALVPMTYFSFEGHIGDVINITVDSGGGLDTSLALNGPDNYQLTFDDDGGAGFDPEINQHILTQDGTYTLMLQSFATGAEGEVRLTLTRSPLRSLDDGPQDVKVSSKQYQQVLKFSGRAGERVQLIAEVIAPASAAPSLTVMQGGVTLATANTTGLVRLVVELVVPQDGDVTVQVSDYDYSEAQFRVVLERMGR